MKIEILQRFASQVSAVILLDQAAYAVENFRVEGDVVLFERTGTKGLTITEPECVLALVIQPKGAAT